MKKEKNLVKFIFEQHSRLGCITRFNNTPRIASESVAEHSYYVAFLSMLIADYLQAKGVLVHKAKLLEMALVHDIEEIISGDIIKVLKSGGFKKELDKLNNKSMEFLMGILEKDGERYFELWDEAKRKESLEAKLIDLVDMVGCIIYCVKEIHLGNRYFREILEFAITKVLKFSQVIPKIKPLIKALSDYSVGYLLEDKKIYEEINRAVRIYDYEE